MGLMVVVVDGSHRLAGDGVVVDLANRWLAHLEVRDFSSRTVRAYAFDVLNFARFLDHAGSSSARSWRRTCSTGWRGSVNRCPAPVGGSFVCSSDVARHRRR